MLIYYLDSELKIFTYQDLLSFFPYRYVDKTKYHKIDEINNTKSEIQLIGKIIDLYEKCGKTKMGIRKRKRGFE